MIPVSRPFLPPKDAIVKHLDDLYKSNQLTNEGQKILDLKKELKKYLDVNNISLVANGTLALQLSIRSLDIKGEVITTPFSYVATASSILWENCTPVFVDINENDLTINADLIEDSINDNTEAIIATHVYGFPCDIDKISRISEKYNLKVIYDGAHAFGVKINGTSIFEYGDLTTCSTHATKLFHTIEGGFVSSKNTKYTDRVELMKNFGHTSPYTYSGIGINAKMSELHALFGLENLKNLDKVILNRKILFDLYDSIFKNVQKIRVPSSKFNYQKNYSYYPIIFSTENELLDFQDHMSQNNIQTRRYFYPSLDTLYGIKNNPCSISQELSKRILCLPVLSEIQNLEIDTINSAIIDYNF